MARASPKNSDWVKLFGSFPKPSFWKISTVDIDGILAAACRTVWLQAIPMSLNAMAPIDAQAQLLSPKLADPVN